MSRGMTRRMFRKPAGAAGMGAAALTPLLQAVSREVALAQTGGTLIYGMASPFDTLDVTVTTSSYVGRMGLHVVDPLVWSVKSGEYAPGLAPSAPASPHA